MSAQLLTTFGVPLLLFILPHVLKPASTTLARLNMRLSRTVALSEAAIRLLVFTRRRQDLTPTQFRDYYEDIHMPLLKNLTGTAFPLTHDRTYVLRDTANYSAEVEIGTQSDFLYDCMAALTFANQDHFDALFALYDSDTVGVEIAENQDNFAEWGKAVLVSEPHVTVGDLTKIFTV